jgi:hypothetical protein
MIVKVNASFVGHSDAIAEWAGREADLFDADPVSDDRLASGVMQAGGRVEFVFDLEDTKSADSPFEGSPDLYVLIRNSDGTELFRSEIHGNVDFFGVDPVSGDRKTTLDISFHKA